MCSIERVKSATTGQPRSGKGSGIRHAVMVPALAVWLVLAAGCGLRGPEDEFTGEPYLIVWAGDADRRHPDFLAVVDAHPRSPTYGVVVRTLPVGTAGNEPHAMERTFAPDGLVFAAGMLTDRTFVFDVRDPTTPRIAHVDEPDPTRRYGTPRAFLRIANGNRVATCGDRRGYRGGVLEMLRWAGGLVEFDARGRAVREIDASDPDAAGMLTSPHGIAFSPETRRLLLTDGGHGYTPTAFEWVPGSSIQLREGVPGELLQTLPLGVGERGDENLGPITAHLFRQGTRALVSTAEGAGLYASQSIRSPTPVFDLVHDFGAGSLPGQAAVTPNGRFYLQTLTRANRLEVFDVTDPMKPRLVDQLRFDQAPGQRSEVLPGGPHAVALSVGGRRLAVANYTIDVPGRHVDGDRRVYLIDVNPQDGDVRFDRTFRDEYTGAVGIDFNRTVWPHGKTGPARPAAVLFVAPIAIPDGASAM
jgi:hypothetical protein